MHMTLYPHLIWDYFDRLINAKQNKNSLRFLLIINPINNR